MSARIEWINTHHASVSVIEDGGITPDGQIGISDGNVGLLLTGENGDGIVIEGDHKQLLKLLVDAAGTVAGHWNGLQP